MKCALCQTIINNDKRLLSPVKAKPKLCKQCISKYLPDIHLSKIPITNYFIWHFYITNQTIPNNLKDSFTQYFKPFYLLAAHYQKTTMVFDDFPDSEILSIIDQLQFGDIILITFDYGKEYEDEN